MPLNDNFIYLPPQDPLEMIYEDEDLVVDGDASARKTALTIADLFR
jgi:hypothetical protein